MPAIAGLLIGVAMAGLGIRLLIVQPLDRHLAPKGRPVVAADGVAMAATIIRSSALKPLSNCFTIRWIARSVH